MNIFGFLAALLIHVPEIITDVEAGISRISSDTTVQKKIVDTTKLVSPILGAVAGAATTPPPGPAPSGPSRAGA